MTLEEAKLLDFQPYMNYYLFSPEGNCYSLKNKRSKDILYKMSPSPIKGCVFFSGDIVTANIRLDRIILAMFGEEPIDKYGSGTTSYIHLNGGNNDHSVSNISQCSMEDLRILNGTSSVKKKEELPVLVKKLRDKKSSDGYNRRRIKNAIKHNYFPQTRRV